MSLSLPIPAVTIIQQIGSYRSNLLTAVGLTTSGVGERLTSISTASTVFSSPCSRSEMEASCKNLPNRCLSESTNWYRESLTSVRQNADSIGVIFPIISGISFLCPLSWKGLTWSDAYSQNICHLCDVVIIHYLILYESRNPRESVPNKWYMSRTLINKKKSW